MNIQQEFDLAHKEYNDNEEAFKPLIEKFNELKDVIQKNFIERRIERKWYGAKKIVSFPHYSVEIEEKINYKNGRFLCIKIDGQKFVMGLGEFGELKDRLYFIEGTYLTYKQKTCVYYSSGIFTTLEYYLENKITNVQLFSQLIRTGKNYLVTR